MNKKILFIFLIMLVGIVIFIPVKRVKAISVPTNLSTSGQGCDVGGIALPPTLSWNSVLSADKYKWEVKDGEILVMQDETSNTSVSAPGLSAATEYTWKVRACDTFGSCGGWSECFFATAGNLDQPALKSPDDGEETSLTPKLEWDPVKKAGKYWLWVEEDITGVRKIYENISGYDQTSFTVPEGKLLLDTTYKWYVWAKTSSDLIGSPASNVWSFKTTATLAKPSLTSPSNGATNIALTPTLRWSSVIGADEYTWEIIGIASGDVSAPDTSKSIPAGTLTAGTYTWRVKAKSGGIDSDWSDVWMFTTVGAVPPCASGTWKPHKECVGNVCTSIDSCGIDRCRNNADCAAGPSPPPSGGECDTDADCSGLACHCDSNPGDGIKEGVCASAGAVVICPPTHSRSFEDLVASIINFIFMLAIAIAPIMFIIAGFAFITAAGDPAKIQKAKDIVLWTIIGLAIVLMAYGIINVIQEIFSG